MGCQSDQTVWMLLCMTIDKEEPWSWAKDLSSQWKELSNHKSSGPLLCTFYKSVHFQGQHLVSIFFNVMFSIYSLRISHMYIMYFDHIYTLSPSNSPWLPTTVPLPASSSSPDRLSPTTTHRAQCVMSMHMEVGHPLGSGVSFWDTYLKKKKKCFFSLSNQCLSVALRVGLGPRELYPVLLEFHGLDFV